MRLGEASMKPLSFIPVLSLTAINLSGAYPAARHYLCSQDGERRRGGVRYESGRSRRTETYAGGDVTGLLSCFCFCFLAVATNVDSGITIGVWLAFTTEHIPHHKDAYCA